MLFAFNRVLFSHIAFRFWDIRMGNIFSVFKRTKTELGFAVRCMLAEACLVG